MDTFKNSKLRFKNSIIWVAYGGRELCLGVPPRRKLLFTSSASYVCWCLVDSAKYYRVCSHFMHGIMEISLGNMEDLYILSNPYLYSLLKTLNSKDLNIYFLFLNAL